LRRTRIFIIAGFGLFVFIGISAMLARALSATGTERERVLQVVQAEAKGDARSVLTATPACAREPARSVRHPAADPERRARADGARRAHALERELRRPGRRLGRHAGRGGWRGRERHEEGDGECGTHGDWHG